MGSPACAAAASRRSTGLPRRDAPALKTGQLKLGAGAARVAALASPPHAWEQPSFVCRGYEGDAAVCWYLTRGSRDGRGHKPTEPQRSLRRFCYFGCPAVGFTRRACQERAWRQMRAKSIAEIK